MKIIYAEVPYASFRKSYARSFAETYPLPPPATVYGMLLSLVGERFRHTHEGVLLAFAYKRLPRIATTLRKLSRFKYGVPSKQTKHGNAPDFVETLSGIEFLCWIDSSQEKNKGLTKCLEERIELAINFPLKIDRFGVLCLGLSDDGVNDVKLIQEVDGKWRRLLPSDVGKMELPVWVDHVGSANTRWQRYDLETEPRNQLIPSHDGWKWTQICAPK